MRMSLAMTVGAASACLFVALGNLAASGRLQLYVPVRSARVAVPAMVGAVLLAAIYVGALLACRGLEVRRAPPRFFFFLFGALLWLAIVMPVTQVLLTHY